VSVELVEARAVTRAVPALLGRVPGDDTQWHAILSNGHAKCCPSHVFLVQLLLPLYDHAGRRVSQNQFVRVREELTERYGGVTAYLRSPAQGTWKEGDGAVERDEVVMCEVMVDALDRPWWTEYKRRLEQQFGQEEIVIRAAEMERL
jgi:hypothetical protein